MKLNHSNSNFFQQGSISEFLFSMQGRVSREQYFGYFVIHIAISIVTLAIALFPLYLILGLYTSIAITVKRAHDINKSGYFVWLCLIPLIGLIPSLMLLFLKGTKGSNQYGHDPLANQENEESRISHIRQKNDKDIDEMFDKD